MSKQYLGTFEQVVLLGLAAIDGDADGMSIVDAIASASGREVSVPAVYVTLKRLEKKGLVSSGMRAAGARRKVFRLEPLGIEELAKAKDLLDSLWTRVRLARLSEET